MDLAPIAFELFGDQHSEPGHRALPHLGARDADRHRVIRRDHDPAVDFASADLSVSFGVSKRNCKAQCQRAGTGTGADKQ
jgi:hypothetical protein